jgi:hypothetical protein
MGIACDYVNRPNGQNRGLGGWGRHVKRSPTASRMGQQLGSRRLVICLILLSHQLRSTDRFPGSQLRNTVFLIASQEGFFSYLGEVERASGQVTPSCYKVGKPVFILSDYLTAADSDLILLGADDSTSSAQRIRK